MFSERLWLLKTPCIYHVSVGRRSLEAELLGKHVACHDRVQGVHLFAICSPFNKSEQLVDDLYHHPAALAAMLY
jgi:hypothetical protein